MEQLLSALRLLLANNIAIKFKAHGYHWNVESDDFHQLHEFFAEIYEDYDGATDTYAEWLRMLKSYAPYRLVDFFDLMNKHTDKQIVAMYHEYFSVITTNKDLAKKDKSLNERLKNMSNFFHYSNRIGHFFGMLSQFYKTLE